MQSSWPPFPNLRASRALVKCCKPFAFFEGLLITLRNCLAVMQLWKSRYKLKDPFSLLNVLTTKFSLKVSTVK